MFEVQLIQMYCRLGTESAKAYRECPVDHWSKKQQKTVDEKASLAGEYTENFRKTAAKIIPKIFCTDNIVMIKKFYHALQFINEQLFAYSQEHFPHTILPTYPLNIHYQYKVTGEDAAIDMYQSDCHLLLADVVGFARCARNVLAGCRDPVKLNMYIHFAYAIDAYFLHIKSKTPAFWDKQPQNVPKRPLPPTMPPFHLN